MECSGAQGENQIPSLLGRPIHKKITHSFHWDDPNSLAVSLKCPQAVVQIDTDMIISPIDIIIYDFIIFPPSKPFRNTNDPKLK